MRQYVIHMLLIFAYFILPLAAIYSGELTHIGLVKVDQAIMVKISYYLILSFCSVLVITKIVDMTLRERIKWAINVVKEVNLSYVNLCLYLCIAVVLFYSMKLLILIDPSMTRDERFQLLEHSGGSFFMLFIKIGALLSALSLIRANYRPALFFIASIALYTLPTYSRSLLAVVFLALLPLFKIKTRYALSLVSIIFISRLILTKNFDYSWSWLFTFGIGEMIGVMFGPYTLLSIPQHLSVYENIILLINSIPGLSLISKLDGNIPELAVFVNMIVEKEFGIYGVAGTTYVDLLLSPVVFIFSLMILLLIYLTVLSVRKSRSSAILLFSVYFASAINILSLYRWSLSGYAYSIVRDSTMFILFLHLLWAFGKGRFSLNFNRCHSSNINPAEMKVIKQNV